MVEPTRATTARSRDAAAAPATPAVAAPSVPAAGVVQTVLDLVPEPMALLAPIRDETGAIVDYVGEAASPEASDSVGRRGRQLVGVRVPDGGRR